MLYPVCNCLTLKNKSCNMKDGKEKERRREKVVKYVKYEGN